jgi:hypothetical protein
MAGGTTLLYEMTKSGLLSADLLDVAGSLGLTGVNLTITDAGLGTWVVADKVTLISYKGTPVTGGFSGYTDDTTYAFGSNQWLINYNDTSGGTNFSGQQNGDYFVTLTMVPEPRAALLGGLALLIILFRRRAL